MRTQRISGVDAVKAALAAGVHPVTGLAVVLCHMLSECLEVMPLPVTLNEATLLSVVSLIDLPPEEDPIDYIAKVLRRGGMRLVQSKLGYTITDERVA